MRRRPLFHYFFELFDQFGMFICHIGDFRLIFGQVVNLPLIVGAPPVLRLYPFPVAYPHRNLVSPRKFPVKVFMLFLFFFLAQKCG